MVSFYSAVRVVTRPLVLAIWRPKVTGVEHFPATGAVLVASNHLSLLDSFLLPVIAPRQIRFIARADLWRRPGIKGLAMRLFFTVIGTVPVERGTLRSAQGSLDVALDVLREGDVFGIYPEGTRSRDGRLYKGRTGVAHLALSSGAPIVPVGLQGTDKVFRPGSKIPRIVPVSIAFGAPLDLSDIDPTTSLGIQRRTITARVMDAIAGLSGQERADSLNTPPPEDDV